MPLVEVLVKLGESIFELHVPVPELGRWYDIRVRNTGAEAACLIRYHVESGPVMGLERYAICEPGQDARLAAAFLPVENPVLNLCFLGLDRLPADFSLVFKPVSRAGAAFALALKSPSAFAAHWQGAAGGPLRRTREALAAMSKTGGVALNFRTWTHVFDQWTARDRATLFASPRRAAWPSLGLLLFENGASRKAIKTTNRSLARQWLQVPVTRIPAQAASSLAAILAARPEDYLGILHAGETLPAHATALFADQAARLGRPAALYADEDHLDRNGRRENPHFKPEISKVLLTSGLLTRSIWLFRREKLAQLREVALPTADEMRLELALLLIETPANRFCRIPFILSHAGPESVPVPLDGIGRIIRRYLPRAALSAQVDASAFPVKVRMDGGTGAAGAAPRVSLVVPTTARAAHVTDCLTGILRHTSYPDFEMILVISQPGPLDEEQETMLAPLRASDRVRILHLETKRFNFSQATNLAAARATGGLICLLNDDVVPISPDWLSIMAGHLEDPGVGAVGPKLLYPDNTVQHGGVIIGLAGFCDHASRFLPEDAPGYFHRAQVDHDVSGVTGACLLVRRSVFEALGGLDETYEIAFSDIDFCLRLRDSGWRIVFAATAKLWHHESISLGSHYEGDRAGLAETEIARMRERWQDVAAADPFHNPNLSLAHGREWQLAFPPRVKKPFGAGHDTDTNPAGPWRPATIAAVDNTAKPFRLVEC